MNNRNHATTDKWVGDNKADVILTYRKSNMKPRVTKYKPTARLKPAPTDWRPLLPGELEILRAQPKKVRTRLSRFCSLNGKIHKCLSFDDTSFTYRTSLTFDEIEELS